MNDVYEVGQVVSGVRIASVNYVADGDRYNLDFEDGQRILLPKGAGLSKNEKVAAFVKDWRDRQQLATPQEITY